MMFTLILQFFVWFVLFMLPLSQASGSQCFRPNGIPAADDFPCEPSHSQSFCCGVGWTCAMDKVCYPTIALGGDWQSFGPTRGSCTDVSWTSSECPKYCLSSLDAKDNAQTFYECPNSNPPTYCCHQQNCDCANGGDFKLPPVDQISLIMEPPKSSIVVQTVSVLPTYVVPSLVSVTFTNTPLPSTTSEQSTSSSQAQSTSSQSPEVNQASAADVASAKSGARKFDIDFVMPAVALSIGTLVFLVFRY